MWGSINIPAISAVFNNEGYLVAEWLERKHNLAKVIRFPERDEIDGKIDDQLIVEYYSR